MKMDYHAITYVLDITAFGQFKDDVQASATPSHVCFGWTITFFIGLSLVVD